MLVVSQSGRVGVGLSNQGLVGADVPTRLPSEGLERSDSRLRAEKYITEAL